MATVPNITVNIRFNPAPSGPDLEETWPLVEPAALEESVATSPDTATRPYTLGVTTSHDGGNW